MAVAGCVGVTVWMLRGAATTSQLAGPVPAVPLESPPVTVPAPANRSIPTPADPERSAAVSATESSADEPASAASRATTDPAATSKSSAPASAHVAGVARDELGFVLADHVVEVSPATAVAGGATRVVEGSGVTNAEGRFRIEGLTPGLKDLLLLGPGGGDVLRWADWNVKTQHLGNRVELVRDERRLTLAVPESGSEDIVLRSKGHCDILVTARLVDDLSRPIAERAYQFGEEPERFGSDFSGADGSIAELVTVPEDSSFELFVSDIRFENLRDSFEGREASPSGSPRRYLPVEVQLRTAPMQQDLGTLVMARMAGLALSLVDSVDRQPIRQATLRLRCTGGNKPPSDESSEAAGQVTSILWSGRSNGAYELDVTAPGYRPAHQVGVLVAGEEPQPLELILERAQ